VSKYEQKDMSGSLFKNEQKQTDRHPDYSGTATIDGVEMFMDAWIKTADTGRKWMSFSFKPKQQQAAKPAAKQPARQQRDDLDDSIPF
jgi:uncharacterized protein (DUF736 family)